MSNLAKRCIFAFTAMPIVFFLMWYGDYTRWLFVFVLNAIAAYEWAKMISAVYKEKAKFMSIFSPICTIALTMPWLLNGDKTYISSILAIVFMLYIIIAFMSVDVKNLFPWLALHFAAPLYLGLWGGQCLGLFDSGQGLKECSKFIVVMTTLWACDSAAYFAGRFLGKHKFSPQISPKKTWEGAIGGTLFSIFWFWIWTSTGFGYTVFEFSLASAIFFAFVVSVVGQLGDLLMSALKRWSSIKDTGGIFPGHGGVLDRADSFYLAAPIATILLFYCSV